MCDPVTAAIVGSAVLGTAATAQAASKERKAVKSRQRGIDTAAKEKLVSDKKARVSKQESVATGQVKGVDAANALKALGASTNTGASQTLGAGNVQKQEFLGG